MWCLNCLFTWKEQSSLGVQLIATITSIVWFKLPNKCTSWGAAHREYWMHCDENIAKFVIFSQLKGALLKTPLKFDGLQTRIRSQQSSSAKRMAF